MASLIFVNLPVKDLDRSVRFFSALGYTFDAQYTNDIAACMVISDTIFVMLLTEAKFATFAPNPICDATQSTEVLLCLTVDNREDVDALVSRAVAAGGTIYNQPQDYGFMYSHCFQDLDGHVWEIIHMDKEADKEADKEEIRE